MSGRFFGVLSLFGVVLGVGCENGAKEQQVPDGEFSLYMIENEDLSEGDVSAFEGLSIIIDRDAETLTVQLADGTSQTADLLLRAEEEWEADCYTNDTHALTEVFDVDVESLDLGAATVDQPVLSAKCGGRPMLGAAGADSTFSGAVYYFEALD